jgi:hypothetical protein
MLRIAAALVACATLVSTSGCNCGPVYVCRYREACYNCPSSSARDSCVELGPSSAGCSTTANETCP